MQKILMLDSIPTSLLGIAQQFSTKFRTHFIGSDIMAQYIWRMYAEYDMFVDI